MAMTWDGPGPCVSCGTWNSVHYRNEKEYCSICDVYQLEYQSNGMIKNLLKFGFKKVEVLQKLSFFQKLINTNPKIVETYYEYGSIKAEYIDDSSNMKLTIGDKFIVNFSYYGDYDYVESQLNRIIKPYLRRLKLEKINTKND